MEHFQIRKNNFLCIFLFFSLLLYPNAIVAQSNKRQEDIIQYLQYSFDNQYCKHQINKELSIVFQSDVIGPSATGYDVDALFEFAIVKVPYTVYNSLNYKLGSIFDIGISNRWNKAKLLKIDDYALVFAVDPVFLSYLWGLDSVAQAGDKNTSGPFFYLPMIDGLEERVALSRAITCSIEAGR